MPADLVFLRFRLQRLRAKPSLVTGFDRIDLDDDTCDAPRMRRLDSTARSSRVPLIVGVTGHRDPLDPAGVRRQLGQLFRQLRECAPSTPIVLLSPLAAGCDQLFAEVGLEVLGGDPGVELVVPMPFELEDYRVDFEGDPAALVRFEALRSRARHCFALPPRSEQDLVDWLSPDGRLIRRVLADWDGVGGEPSARDVHYDRLGRFIAAHAHLVVALWNGWGAETRDGLPTQLGGTASVVAYCREGRAQEVGRGVPLHEELSSVTVASTVPVAVLHCRRLRDTRLDPRVGQDLSEPMREASTSDAEGSAGKGLQDGVLAQGLACGARWRAPHAVMEEGAVLEVRPHSVGAPSVARTSTVEFGRLLECLEVLNEVNPRASGQVGLVSRFESLVAWSIARPLAFAWGRSSWLFGRFGGADSAATRYLKAKSKAVRAIWLDRPREAYIEEPLRSEADRSRVDPADSLCIERLRGIFERADRCANQEHQIYQRGAWVAIALLGFALVLFQFFGAFANVPSRLAIFGYLILLLLFMQWGGGLKRREGRRSFSRCFAEVSRVQFIWRTSGIRCDACDRLLPRRRAALGHIRHLLTALRLDAVIPSRGEDEVVALESVRRAAHEGWISGQIRYLEGESTRRKRASADRMGRGARLVRWVAVLAAIGAAAIVAVGAGAAGGAGDPDDWPGAWLMPWTEFLIGLSLVVVLLAEFWAQISQDREDADSNEKALQVYTVAKRQLEERLAALDLEGARQVLFDLGESIVDEQIEWYIRHRDGVDVDAVA